MVKGRRTTKTWTATFRHLAHEIPDLSTGEEKEKGQLKKMREKALGRHARKLK